MCDIIARFPEIKHLNEVLTMHMGPDFILVNVSVDFADNLTADLVETTIERLDGEIKARFPRVKRVFVEAEARVRKNSEGEAMVCSRP
jgi:divalent metal cation (Fe/Co/Zn/Cd) transporter